jgi:hypothetical protein
VSPLITHYPSLSGIGQTCPDLAIAIFSGGEARTRLREIVMQNRPEPPFLRVLPIESPNQSLAALLDLASYMKIRSRNSALSRVRSAICAEDLAEAERGLQMTERLPPGLRDARRGGAEWNACIENLTQEIERCTARIQCRPERATQQTALRRQEYK